MAERKLSYNAAACLTMPLELSWALQSRMWIFHGHEINYFFIQSISVAHCSEEACVFLSALLLYSVVEVVDGESSSVTSSENRVMTEVAVGPGLNRDCQGRSC